jgi:hypothetical protein
MNPLASSKCAGRLLMALAAISGIFLTAGCGSGSGIVPTNPVGFSNSSLNGTYVFSSSGIDSDGDSIAIAGALVANGSGGITGGTMDIVDPGVGIATGQTIGAGSSYRITGDGRGQAALNSAGTTFVLDFVLISTSHGLVTEFDSIGGGSGTIDLQTALTGQSQLAGPYAFTLGGYDGGGASLAEVGAFTLNSSGAVTAGVADFNDDGSPINNLPLTGTATVGSGTAPGVATFSSQTFDFYPIDATHLKFIETDDIDFLSGDVFNQTSSSIPTGPMVFTMSGGISVPIADGGLMTYSGTTFTGYEDFNSNGNVGSEPTFTGASAAVGPVGGRVIVSLSSFVPATQWVVYPSSGGLLMMENDALNVTQGTALAQTPGQTIGASQNFGLNLSAFNTSGAYYENDIAQFLTTASAFSGAIDINDNFGPEGEGIVLNSLALTGTYTLDSPATGRGEATTTIPGGSYIGFTFYVANNSTILLLETDTNASQIGAQIGAGIFQLQSPPSGSVAQQSHISLAHPAVLSPAARARVAARSKKQSN